jgi:DNA polymerase
MTANRKLGRALARRLEFERLFGIEEVYVSAKRTAEAKAKRGPAAPSVRKRAAAGAKRSRRKVAPAASRKVEGEKAESGKAAADVSAPAGPAHRFVMEDAPGAAQEELSLFPEDMRDGVPRVSTRAGPNAERLRELEQAAGACARCRLAETRTEVVFGEGDAEARLVFVGEAPGADEDATGRPFVGRAGKLLTKIIEAMNLAREEVFICNVLKCRPPGNRTPAPDEVTRCSPFLHEQLAVIRPRVICALGGPATKTLLGTKEGITKLRGRFFRYRAASPGQRRGPDQGTALMPTFHPAYLLRSMSEKAKVWADMKKIMAFLASREASPEA